MKNDKITIDMYPLGEKIFGTVFLGFWILFLSLPLLLSGGKLDWRAILIIIILDIFSLYMIFLSFFSRIVFDGERGTLKLYDFWVRSIPLQDIKVVERDDYMHSGRGFTYCIVYIELINGKKKRIVLSVPRGAKQKSWLEHIDQEIADLNKRIDEWYMEYRKQSKKR